jgi:hypothetical protein
LKTIGMCSSARRVNGGRAVLPVLLVAALVLALPRHAAAGDNRFSVIVHATMTTSSQIFQTPDAVDLPLQAQSLTVSDFFGYGAELRYHIPETSVSIGVSAEYIRARRSTSIATQSYRFIPVEDGYTVIPVEVTGYFLIPFSGDTFGVFMGGGAGLYFGTRSYAVGNLGSVSSPMNPGFGIHVLGGLSYRFFGPLAAVFEMKFRDVQFRAENVFRSSPVRYNDLVLNVATAPFASRVQTDGIVLQLGLAFTL